MLTDKEYTQIIAQERKRFVVVIGHVNKLLALAAL